MAFHFDDYGLMPTIRPARVWALFLGRGQLHPRGISDSIHTYNVVMRTSNSEREAIPSANTRIHFAGNNTTDAPAMDVVNRCWYSKSLQETRRNKEPGPGSVVRGYHRC